jgi:hypothetical protein
MLYPETDRVNALKRQLESFMNCYVYPDRIGAHHSRGAIEAANCTG